MLQTILIVLRILFLFGGIRTLPNWSHNRSWGNRTSSGFSLINLFILIVVIFSLTDRL